MKKYRTRFSRDLLEDMVKDWVESDCRCPRSFTLDIGVTSNGNTVIIEAHNFISCGLYGFEHLNIIPNMVISAYKQEKEGVIG